MGIEFKENILNTPSVPIFACDLNGAINACNPTAIVFFKFNKEEITGAHVMSVFHKELQLHILEQVRFILIGIRAELKDTLLISKSDKEIPVNLTISRVILNQKLIGISFSCWRYRIIELIYTLL